MHDRFKEVTGMVGSVDGFQFENCEASSLVSCQESNILFENLLCTFKTALPVHTPVQHYRLKLPSQLL